MPSSLTENPGSSEPYRNHNASAAKSGSYFALVPKRPGAATGVGHGELQNGLGVAAQAASGDGATGAGPPDGACRGRRDLLGGRQGAGGGWVCLRKGPESHSGRAGRRG